jgi:ubiquinone/menaquinone biosynthesis C-methylase UbiE
MSAPAPPNHHAGHAGHAGHDGHAPFHGPLGLLNGVALLVGRGPDARLACELTGTGPGDRVVDIGCGPGVAARRARRRGATVVGVDPAPVMLGLARLVPASGVEWRLGTAEHLPLSDRECSVAWSLATAHHWTDVGRALSEAHRVLAPGGRLLVLERLVVPGATGRFDHGWSETQAAAFAARCGQAGFESVRTELVSSRRPGVAVVARRL